VSLGAYEAGFLYYTLEVAKANPQIMDLRLVTGASAGSINGLLAVLSACGPKVDSPRDSLFWRTWIPLGLKQLYVPSEASAVGLFSRRWFETAVFRIEQVWKRGLSPSCDIVFGVSTTRVSPRLLRTARDRLTLPRIEEQFALRIQGRGPGQAPVVTNYVDPGYGLLQTLLPTNPEGAIDFTTLRDLLYASSAFPLAFPPQLLPSCATDPDRGGTPDCTPATAQKSHFVDGGVLDNSPLRLAARLAGAGLHREDDGSTRWLPSPHFDRFELPDSVRFAFLTPDTTDYPVTEEDPRLSATRSALALVEQLFRSFVSTARAKELFALLEEHPEIGLRVLLPRRHFPTASGLLEAFFGFFETDFRVFDFYLGMYDARRTFEDDAQPQLTQKVAYPEDMIVRTIGHWSSDWRPFACMRGLFDRLPELRAACAGDELMNFRALLQSSLERLWDACARASDHELATPNPNCQAQRRGEPPPRVEGVPGADVEWRRASDEFELAYVVRLAAAHRFQFHDLGLPADQGKLAVARIRGELARLTASLAEAQPPSDRGLVALAGTLGADYVAYAPRRHILYFAIGRQWELGWSMGAPESRFIPAALRLNLALLLDGIPTLLSSGGGFFAFGPAAGIEIQPRALSSLLLQTRLALRVGYLLADGDDFQSMPCRQLSSDRLGACSRLVTQALVGVSMFQRLRAHVLFEWYPSIRSGDSTLWSVTPGVGLELAY